MVRKQLTRMGDGLSVKIGEVGIDSGTLILIDPCYIKYIHDLHDAEKWESFCKNVLFPPHESKDDFAEVENGIVFSNHIGDGSFPVYATKDKEGIKKVEVVF